MSQAGGRRGLVVMAYGTPSGPDQIETYYTHIRRGRQPNAKQLADLARRYEAIGGTSPLAARTRDQAAAIADQLEQAEPAVWRVVLGHKHAPPFVEDAITELTDAGVDRIVGLVLAPHWSAGSVGEYHARARAVADDRATDYVGIESWHDDPAWLDAMAQRVSEGLDELPAPTKVLFTAHSLLERILEGDAYPDQLWASASEIAKRTKIDPWYGWSLAWQSAGRTPEPWRGPDVTEVIRDLGSTGRAASVLICPQGFVSDHLEVLYDLDIDAARVAADAGLAFGRTRSLNDDPQVMAALANRVRRAAASGR